MSCVLFSPPNHDMTWGDPDGEYVRKIYVHKIKSHDILCQNKVAKLRQHFRILTLLAFRSGRSLFSNQQRK